MLGGRTDLVEDAGDCSEEEKPRRSDGSFSHAEARRPVCYRASASKSLDVPETVLLEQGTASGAILLVSVEIPVR